MSDALRPALAVVAERAKTHGDFNQVALLSEELKVTLRCGPNWNHLAVRKREALDMIAVKMARILCGDAAHADHWRDIAGYAALGGDLG